MKTPWRSSFHHLLVARAGARPLHVAGEGEGGAADLGEGPAALDADVDVDPAAAGGLRPADEADVGEGVAHDEGDPADVVPGDARDGVEVDPQLVGMVEVVGPDGMGVEVEAAEVGHPGEAGRIVNDDLVGGPARGEARAPPCEASPGCLSGARFWKKKSPAGAVRVALEGHRPAARAAQSAIRDRDVVADELQLRDGAAGGLREEDLVWVRDRHLAAGDLRISGAGRHGPEDTRPCRARRRGGWERPVATRPPRPRLDSSPNGA